VASSKTGQFAFEAEIDVLQNGMRLRAGPGFGPKMQEARRAAATALIKKLMEIPDIE
jgi:hypothetical protein